jgi:hypothetical protein
MDTLNFTPVTLNFDVTAVTNVFAQKNNKTLAETINHQRYAHLAEEVRAKYRHGLSEPLGTFLYQLKLEGDFFYSGFLNKYGDSTYCKFRITSSLADKGLYSYVVDGQIKYIGRCRDSFGKRINQGYGHIHPKNCYLDGQATNCHLNALINKYRDHMLFYVCVLSNDEEIMSLERNFIQAQQPEWNIQLKNVFVIEAFRSYPCLTV